MDICTHSRTVVCITDPSSYSSFFFFQGVFGFINSHRVNLVLHYTHDPIPGDASPASRMATCVDKAGEIAKDEGGRGYTCPQIEPHCAANANLREACPRTCGVCGRRQWDEATLQAIRWTPLEFKNLVRSLAIAATVAVVVCCVCVRVKCMCSGLGGLGEKTFGTPELLRFVTMTIF